MAGIHCVLLGAGRPQSFPDVAATAEGTGSSTDTIAISSGSMPAHTAGQLLVAAFVCVAGSTPNIATASSGWTLQTTVTSSSGGLLTELAVFTKPANSSSESITADSDSSGAWAWQVFAIDNGTEGGLVDETAQNDPPAVTLLSSQKYLVFVIGGSRLSAFSGAPAGYSDFNATGSSSAFLATATKQVESATSETPGMFSGGGSSVSRVSATVAVQGT